MQKDLLEAVCSAIFGYIYGKNEISLMHEKMHAYIELAETEKNYNSNELKKRILPIINACIGDVLFYDICSFAIEATADTNLCNQFLSVAIEDKSITKEEKYFLYRYVGGLHFLNICPFDKTTWELEDKLYSMSLDAFTLEVPVNYTYIRECDRNKDLVFVFISQFLSLNHGPTKTVLDRCYILQKYMNKRIVLINTAEMCATKPAQLLYKPWIMNYVDSYSDMKAVSYMDCTFQFIQCNREMPNVDMINGIMDMVATMKPYCIVTIGGYSIVTDLCSKIVPTITISTVPSERVQTYGQFQAVGKRLDENDIAWAKRHNLTREHFIESIFTSAFKEQTHHYSREDLKLPKDGFIVTLIGGRLDAEVDDKCMEILLKLMKEGIYVAFMGGFARFDYMSQKEECFRRYAIDLGFQSDVLAVLECRDAYINPMRVGGGTSVAEALYKRVPVVTMDYGDGGLGAGVDFWVDNYDAMFERVMKLHEDGLFYKDMQDKASARAEILMDSKGQFVNIMETAFNRKNLFD